ncbi:aspartoacylase, partial [Thalassiosira pseudonana CCMP1335]
KIAIVGGTHGNEYTGVWCIKSIEKQRELLAYPSLDLHTLLANPVAYMQNKRFVDVDLNREFSVEKLKRALSSLPHEAVRAREIEAILGPKITNSNIEEDPLTDVVIDLHTTTTNMGISLIIPEGDALMSAAAAYYGYENVQCLMHALPQRKDRQNLSSCGRHGFTIEVGPVPQGVIRHDVVEKTEAAMHSLLEFLHLRNLDMVPCYRSAPAVRPGELSGKISWSNDATNPNFPAVMIHKSLQDRDFYPLRVGDPLFVGLDGNVITYDGSHGDEVHLIFVNEGGYY